MNQLSVNNPYTMDARAIGESLGMLATFCFTLQFSWNYIFIIRYIYLSIFCCETNKPKICTSGDTKLST